MKLEDTIPKKEIILLFSKYKNHVLTKSDIIKIFYENYPFLELIPSLSFGTLLDFLKRELDLEKHIYEFPNRNVVRYTLGEVSLFSLVYSIKKNAYFTHYTALYIHQLTEQIPKTIYLNFEQPPKKQKQNAILEQEKIDLAFKNPQRKSNTIAIFGENKVVLLNGMYTGRLGVINYEVSPGEVIDVTDIERTLIDITVRPVYSGGVFEVLNAFRFAKERGVSINKLCAKLRKLNYVYPYHQAIGFYLEKSGVYSDSQINLLRKFDIKYNFYLAHQMKEMEYSRKWRLFFPKGF